MAHQPVQLSNTSRYSKLENAAQRRPARFRDHVGKGWRATISAGGIVISIALIANIVILVWASSNRPLDNRIGAGIVTLYAGSCTEMSRIFTWSHLAINIVSTLILGAGTACMQSLSAPTRQEIDKAHAQSTWLDIGVPSLRNFRWMARQRQVLWVLLGLSSLPLHLFYNSVIFSTTVANDFSAYMVADNFLHAGLWQGSKTNSSVDESAYSDDINDAKVQYLQDNLASLVKLDNEDCLKAYQTSLVSAYKDVLLVTGVSNTTNALLGFIPQNIQNYGAEIGNCYNSFTCWEGSQKNTTDWIFNLFPQFGSYGLDEDGSAQSRNYIKHTTVSVKYCLAEPTSPTCTISLSRVYLGVVIICNVIKLACIISTLALKAHSPIVTIGDAIESFLVYPDVITRASSLSAAEVRKPKIGSKWCATSTRPWFPFRHVAFEAASARRWVVTSLCLVSVWVAALILLIEGAMGSSTHPDIWRNGLGVLSLDSVLRFSEAYSVTVDVLIVNSPQVVLSFIYLMYNGLLTCMQLSREYLKFATQRTSLRVTSPRDGQRSTYWLQLPYGYAIPFLTVMGLLHWLVSQSIFLVRVSVIDQAGKINDNREISGCGWSPDALIVTLVLGALVILALYGIGLRKLPGGMPIASSCSAAISAACHRANGEGEEVVLFPLQYGVHEDNKGGIPQVGFSAKDVRPLVEETIYGSRVEGDYYDGGLDDF